jgi:hypothetical protein
LNEGRIPVPEIDPDKTPEELAIEVERVVLRNPVPEVALAPFAALLVRLSKDAEKSSKRLQRVTDRLFWVSVTILFLTFLLCAKEGIDLYKQYASQIKQSKKLTRT